jgi:hypothetical protein
MSGKKRCRREANFVDVCTFGVANQLQRFTVARCITDLPYFLAGAGVMRKFVLGIAALFALASPAISADMRLPIYKAPRSTPFGAGPAATLAAIRAACGPRSNGPARRRFLWRVAGRARGP